ncbi:pyridoxal phosphate-dependent decarboxylase family protein [Elongatibacter sediminis]|uniref:Pyridoxal-dependent decarboxylase n=1 Tax=Elongatibacter sediminis TaxID=3119006 RepID=A0AAW9R612_9GAMM
MDKPMETLDPRDWDDMRELAHQMVDDAVDLLKSAGEGPVWQPVPGEVRERLRGPAPRQPESLEAIYRQYLDDILPYRMGNIHPRFWAWYMGNGTLTGALGDFLASVMNSNVGGGNHSAPLVEAQVIDWMREIVGFPPGSSGLLTSGASAANLIGLTVARNTAAGYDVRHEGVRAAPGPLVAYASTEVHSCNKKAVETLGLGSDGLRGIPVNDDFKIDLDALRHSIDADRKAGAVPFCVIGSAGTINTGAIDDLEALADLCESEGLWFHIDGAIGAVAALADNVRPLLRGMERADSIALDLHKWMHIPFEAGCALVRSETAHRESFSLTPEYLAHEAEGRGLASGKYWPSDYGLQLSRQFRALKVWMSIREHGLDRYGRMIARNVEQAHYLDRLIEADPALEHMAPTGLDIVCFRFNPGGMAEEALDRLNQDILTELHEQGIAVPSYSTLNGRYCLRVAIANHRSRDEDFDLFVRELLRIGRELSSDPPHGST